MLLPILTAFSLALVQVQDPPQRETLSTTPEQAAPANPTAGASDWHPMSRSAATIYLVDVGSIEMREGAQYVRMARVPATAPRSDYNHEVDIYAVQCARKQLRYIGTTQFDEGGDEIDHYEDETSEWEPVIENSNIGYLFEMTCNGRRASEGSYPTITAYVGQTRD